MSFVTFLIPTKNRYSLKRAIESVENQSDTDYEILIVIDGYTCRYNFNYNNKIKVINTNTTLNNPGKVRNYGLNNYKIKTPWLAFLDDDDFIGEDYIKQLKNNVKNNPETDLFINSIMFMGQKRIIPKIKDQTFRMDDVGINFCYKFNNKTKNLRFNEELNIREDYYFLEEAKNNNLNIYLTHEINYFVPSPSFQK